MHFDVSDSPHTSGNTSSGAATQQSTPPSAQQQFYQEQSSAPPSTAQQSSQQDSVIGSEYQAPHQHHSDSGSRSSEGHGGGDGASHGGGHSGGGDHSGGGAHEAGGGHGGGDGGAAHGGEALNKGMQKMRQTFDRTAAGLTGGAKSTAEAMAKLSAKELAATMSQLEKLSPSLNAVSKMFRKQNFSWANHFKKMLPNFRRMQNLGSKLKAGLARVGGLLKLLLRLLGLGSR
jgi:hypothetical protein